MEGKILLWIQEYMRDEWLTPIIKGISMLSNSGIMWIVLAVILIIVSKTRKEGIVLGIGLVLQLIVCNVILKNLFARPRPYTQIEDLVPLINGLSDYSFPSGHTCVTFICAVILYKKFPKYIGIPAFIFAFITGYTRLYLGVHYPTDVLGGMILGILLGYIALFIGNELENKRKVLKEN